MLFKTENLGLICVFKTIKLDPLTKWNVFFYFFGNYFRWESDGKVDLGNTKRSNEDLANLMIEMFHLVQIVIGNEIGNGNKNRAIADFNRLI